MSSIKRAPSLILIDVQVVSILNESPQLVTQSSKSYSTTSTMKLTLVICMAIMVSLQLAKLASANHHHPSSLEIATGVEVLKEGVKIESVAEKVREVEFKKSLPIKTFEAFAELFSQPARLLVAICNFFTLPLRRVIDFVGKEIIIGKEAIARPIIASFKIFEKIFVPDACLLRKLCQCGKYLEFARNSILQYSPKVLKGSDIIKSVTDGIIGQDCNVVYDNCELTIKPEIKKFVEQEETIVGYKKEVEKKPYRRPGYEHNGKQGGYHGQSKHDQYGKQGNKEKFDKYGKHGTHEKHDQYGKHQKHEPHRKHDQFEKNEQIKIVNQELNNVKVQNNIDVVKVV